MTRKPIRKIRDRVIWDVWDNVMHRGAMTKGEARAWLRHAVRIFKVDEAVVKGMYEIRRIVK